LLDFSHTQYLDMDADHFKKVEEKGEKVVIG